MAEAIFLSASVPDPKRSPKYASTAEPVAIAAAVSALVYVTLGRRMLIWGGHPAITPMVWVAAQDMGVEYASWVHLYQSRYFKNDFPEEDANFRNVTYTSAVQDDQERSLQVMRERMFSSHEFSAAVFIGGMDGIVREFEMFHRSQPHATIVPVMSTGGAALTVADALMSINDDLRTDLDYVALFHRHLGISVREERYVRPSEQPPTVTDRYWRPRGRSG